MSTQWLGEIMNIDEVEGAFITSMRGNIVDQAGNFGDIAMLKSVSAHLLKTFGAFHTIGKKPVEMELYWDNKIIICKNAGDFLLVTVVKSAKVLSLLRITLNVVTANLSEEKKFQKIIRQEAADKALFVGSDRLEADETGLIAALK